MKQHLSVWMWIGGMILAAILGFSGGRWSAPANQASVFLGKSASSTVPDIQLTGLGKAAPSEVSREVDFQQFWNLWQLLKQNYYKQPIKDQTLFYGAMNGLASSLGDPYTSFFNPQSAEDFQSALEGKFEGIGAEIGIKDDQLQIIAPLAETPAERAGLMAGDIIVKVGKEDTTGMTVEKAVSLIRGPKGTKVTLTIFRPAQKKPPFDVVITREEIRVKSVNWKMLPNQIALIEVTHFNGDTREGFDQAAAAIAKKNPKGIILDLRNNPGGFLDTALTMAGSWIGDDVVVKERKQGVITDVLRGSGRPILAGIRTIVLVNQGSASASEIVAGALQDHKQATLLGMKTFGKGSVQNYMNFDDGSGVKITIAEWLTPNERAINKVGLDPDVVVDRTPEDYVAQRDPQLDRALSIFAGTGTSTPAVVSTSTRP